MEADKFVLRVFTPAGLLLEEQVSSVTLAGKDGEIGLLPLHTRYTGILGTGLLEYVMASGEHKRAVISGGFCSYAAEMLTLLADSVDLPEEINAAKYAEKRKEYEHTLAHEDTSGLAWIMARERLSRIEAIDRLIGREAN